VALIVGLNTPGAIGTAVTIAAAAVLLYVVLLALHVLSLRLELHPGEVHVASLITRRRHALSQGRVTRLRVEPRRGIFGTQLGGFGIELGRGTDPQHRDLEVIRLLPASTMIVIPTDRGRLAVRPASEPALLRALELAARGVGIDTSRVAAQPRGEEASR
jgi:hypothetical protein